MADSSKDILLRELKDIQERDNLKDELNLLCKKIIDTSSEKYSPDFLGQLNLFHEEEMEQDTAEVEELAVSLPAEISKKENTGLRMPNVSRDSR